MLRPRILLSVLIIGALLAQPAQARQSDPSPINPRSAVLRTDDLDGDRISAARAVAEAQAQLPPPNTFGAADMRAATARARLLGAPPMLNTAVHPAGERLQASVQVSPNIRLGVNFANYYVSGPGNGPRAYAQMRAAGASYDRIAFNMYLLQPAAGVFTWDAYDALIQDAAAQNMSLLGVLTAPPAFASTGCPATTGAEFRTPTNLDKAWDDPANTWARWVYTTVLRYKDTVRAWEVWNEPNFDVFWCGTPQQFAQMTRVSYQAIKAADPSAIVVSAPMYRGVNIERIARFFEALRDLPDAVANNYYHDVIGFHLYDGGHCTQFDEIEFLNRDFFKPNVGDKPIWNTESGIRVREGAWPEFAAPDESAYFLTSNYAYSLHKNVGKYFYWRAIDERAVVQDADYDVTWGLLQFNGAPRPSYQAFQTVAKYLPQQFEWSVRKFGNKFADDKSNGPVARISFYNTPLGRVSVLYNISSTAQIYTFTGVLSNATFVYPNGATQVQTRTAEGAHVLAMPASTNFRWGKPECQTPGRPLIIIESDTTVPTATLQTLPFSTTTGLTLTWTSSDTLDGSGIWWHDVQFQKDGSPWQLYKDEITGSAVRFDPPGNGVYALRVRPRDRAGNVPPWEAMNAISVSVSLTLSQRIFLPLTVK